MNNAGIFPGSTTLATDEATFDRVYGVNVKAGFFLTQALAPVMIKDGGGAIINLGSWVARLGLPVGAVYSSSKGAVETLTRAWAARPATRTRSPPRRYSAAPSMMRCLVASPFTVSAIRQH